MRRGLLGLAFVALAACARRRRSRSPSRPICVRARERRRVAHGRRARRDEDAPPTTTSTTCVDQRLGAVVLAPSGDDDGPIAFKVVGAIDGQSIEQCTPRWPAGCADHSTCAPDYGPSCIVARRALATRRTRRSRSRSPFAACARGLRARRRRRALRGCASTRRSIPRSARAPRGAASRRSAAARATPGRTRR